MTTGENRSTGEEKLTTPTKRRIPIKRKSTCAHIAVLIALLIFPASALSASSNAVVGHAEKAGMKKNLATVQSLSEFLSEDALDWGAHSFWITDGGDNRLFSSALELVYNKDSAFALVTVSPAIGQEVPEFSYMRAYHSPMNQVQLREDDYKDWEYRGTISKNIVVLEHNNLNVYLMPAGPGTMVFKRESGSGS